MSGNVEQEIARSEKFDRFKNFVVREHHVALATAIASWYPNVAKNSDRYNSLMRAATLARQFPHRLNQ